jgi:hypothetical protein
MVALMRTVLSVSGLLVVTLVPAGSERFDSPQSLALVVYAIYSLVVWVCELKGVRLFRPLQDWGHWIDVGFYTLLIILNRGTVSIVFWYFFPILVASFRWGFWSGIRVVTVSTILFSAVTFVAAPPGSEIDQQRFLIRPIYFLTIGYMMSYWGGSEVRLRPAPGGRRHLEPALRRRSHARRDHEPPHCLLRGGRVRDRHDRPAHRRSERAACGPRRIRGARAGDADSDRRRRSPAERAGIERRRLLRPVG